MKGAGIMTGSKKSSRFWDFDSQKKGPQKYPLLQMYKEGILEMLGLKKELRRSRVSFKNGGQNFEV